MTDADVVSAIERLSENATALNRLLEIPRRDVSRILALLSNAETVDRLRGLLSRLVDIDPDGKSGALAARQRKMPSGARDLEGPLRNVLSDRRRFPTVSAVAQFVTEVFGIRVPRLKDNRDRYVTRVVRAVTSNRRALYHARNALVHGELDRRDKAYVLLYDFIRGRRAE
jgi:hypothetical protein